MSKKQSRVFFSLLFAIAFGVSDVNLPACFALGYALTVAFTWDGKL